MIPLFLKLRKTPCTRMALWGAVLSAAALMVACRPAGAIRQPDMQALPTASQALETLRKTGAERRTIRAAGRVTYYGDKGRVRVRTEVVARRAGQFRVETISPFEQPIDVMACDGDELWLLSKGVLKKGQATPNNVARLLPLPLAPSEIVDTLMGGIPTGDGFFAEKLTPTDRGAWLLTVARKSGEERVILTVDPVRTVVTRATIERPIGTPYLSAVFEDFIELEEGGHYPEKIRMTMPGRDVDVRLKFKTPEINVDLDSRLFRLSPPPGQAVQPL